MRKRSLVRPTDGELEILKVLWQRGPGTVREVDEAINATKPAAYTTTLKLLQIMCYKGLVVRGTKATTLSPDGVAVHSKAQLLDNNAWTAPALVGTKLYARDRKVIMALEVGK